MKRISFVGQQLKKQGLKKGVSDLLLAYPSQGYHGLWLELKAANGRLTPEQIDWLNLAKKAGYAATVAYSLDQGMTVINNYLKVKL